MIVAGVDEVGRGCWAGPLVAGAVILPTKLVLQDEPIVLRDSKKMTKKQRAVAANWININAEVGLGWVWPAEIDEHGLSWAVNTAMHRAVDQLTTEYGTLIIDGNINYFPDNVRASAVIQADNSVPSVSAASIVAKVARDDYMSTLDTKYDQYEFQKHVGYGTAGHIDVLKKFGVSDIHRRSYKPIKALLT